MNAKVEKLNDAPILDQMEGNWQLYMMLVLEKLTGGKVVEITVDDIQAFSAKYGDQAVLFTHGHQSSTEFSIVTRAQAEVLAQHQRDATKSRGGH